MDTNSLLGLAFFAAMILLAFFGNSNKSVAGDEDDRVKINYLYSDLDIENTSRLDD